MKATISRRRAAVSLAILAASCSSDPPTSPTAPTRPTPTAPATSPAPPTPAVTPAPPPPAPPPAVHSVVIDPSAFTRSGTIDDLVPGMEIQLRAEARDADGNPIEGAAIAWASSAPDVATVSDSGLMTTVGIGSARITATSGLLRRFVDVYVDGLPHVVVASARVRSTPGDFETGYLDGDRITVAVRWARAVARGSGVTQYGDTHLRIRGVPYLELQIGEHVRPAVMTGHFPDDGEAHFSYIVGRDDHDADGVGWKADAIQLVNGAEVFDPETGEALPVLLDGNDRDGRPLAVENHESHKVRPHDPEPAPRMCSVEVREALKYVGAEGSVVGDWDGTPIRVDVVDNFPAHVTAEDLRELLAPIGTAAEKIEAKLGYPVLELGGIVPVPEGTPPGWDRDYDRFFAAAAGTSERAATAPLLRREKHQLLAFYLDDDAWFWDHVGGPPMVAFTYAGATSYNKRTSGDWWYGLDDCCLGRWAPNGRDGHTIVHEVFHLLGFRHPDEPPDKGGVLMAWGSTIAPWLTASPVHYVADKDIEVLGCLFPEGGR